MKIRAAQTDASKNQVIKRDQHARFWPLANAETFIQRAA
jgi:hypothetical protein